MSKKIQILFSIVDSFNVSKNNPSFKNHPAYTKEFIATFITNSDHFKKQTSDQAWYAKVSSSFVQAMVKNQDPHDWLVDQLKQIGVYQVSKNFQGNHIPGHHCMTFLSDLLYGKVIKKYANPKKHFSERMSSYLIDSKAKAIPKEKLTTGDLIIYRGTYPNKKYDYIHVAIFIEEINGEMYATSKFGIPHPVLIHRIDDVLDNCQESLFYKNNFKLHSDTYAKFAALKEELYSGLQWNTVQEIKAVQGAHPKMQEPKVLDKETKLPQTVSHEENLSESTSHEKKLPARKSMHEMNGFGSRLHSGHLHLWPSIKLSDNKDGINKEERPGKRPNAEPVFRR